ncbi:hypothetical protein GH741_13720 [Aquibacillus halophilus]|uniref:Phenylalanyl-tRNA synthetase subunit beta n=1 Tax=Aquibacillus halophilus TaxID=930132 RepID=A0A6A8DJ03_9BACI|nr:hypothetical protein [Aquibacillus halophilus]MRH43731.1 hypothetical protein [Aquibacillus halophilus]
MRFIKWLIMITIVVAIGYQVYHIGTNVVADKVMELVVDEFENMGELELLKQSINSDPEIQRFVLEGANIAEGSLPFTTKEEAIKVIVKKLDINEVKEIKSTIENGVTPQEQQELLRRAESKLTVDELNALKVVFYKEIYNN